MSDSATASPNIRHRNLGVLFAAGGVLLLTMWCVGQSGLEPTLPARFAVNVLIVLEALPMLGALWLGAAGLGYPLRRALLPDHAHGAVAQLGLGMGVLLVINWLLAWAGVLNAASAWGLCAVGVVLLVVQLVQVQRARPDGGLPAMALSWALPLAMLGPGMMLVAAACPPGTLWRIEAMGYDVLSYHLQLPREWLEAGAMTGFEHNVYSYLPSLMEAAYMMLGAMQGSVHDAIYTTQLFHASFTLLAAAAVGCAVARFAGATAGVITGAVLLALPWVIVTGSLAYNEMAVLAFGAVALGVMLDPTRQANDWRSAAAIGALLGAATLAKLTAGLMLAVPLGLIALLSLHRDTPWRVNVRFAGVMAITGLLVLAPYLVRNTIWTGNPVFPFATSVFGEAHWNHTLVERWHEGHSPGWAHGGRIAALTQHWLLNTGYGALGGYATERTAADMARFDREGGVPVLWLAVTVATVLVFREKRTRPLAMAMGVLIALQLVVWLMFTHMQSRFLVPTLLPAALLLGGGLGRLHALTAPGRAWIMPMIGATLVLTFTVSSVIILHQQSRPVTSPDGVTQPAAPALLIDALAEPDGQMPGWPGDHAINALGPNTKTYLVADNQSLLYIRRPIVYHTPFDPSPLGAMIREAGGDPRAVNRQLRAAGVTHVWISWSELDRLHETYGYDGDVTRDTFATLIASGWHGVQEHGRIAALYALPTEP